MWSAAYLCLRRPEPIPELQRPQKLGRFVRACMARLRMSRIRSFHGARLTAPLATALLYAGLLTPPVADSAQALPTITVKYWTSAGVTAGMDMSLALLNDNWGQSYTQGVMLDMESDPAPPIQGGTLEKTSWLVAWMVKAMYDAGDPLIQQLEAEKSARTR